MSDVIATYRPHLRAIRLYRDRIEYGKQGGSLRGVEAEVAQTGSKRLVRDTRQTYLEIVGEDVAISVRIKNDDPFYGAQAARKFAAKVNMASKAFKVSR